MLRFIREDRSAASIIHDTELATQVLRDIPQEHLNALRDFYVSEQEEVLVCTRHRLTHEEFREIKSRAPLRFSQVRNFTVAPQATGV